MTLEYARPMTLNSIEGYIAFRRMLFLSILSGACVGSCFLTFSGGYIGAGIQLVIFGLTLFAAVGAGKALMLAVPDDSSRFRRMMLDVTALLALLIIGTAPMVLQVALHHDFSTNEPAAPGVIGIAFLLLAISTPRHAMLYRILASLCRSVNRYAMAKALTTLGWFKTFYEMLWLGSCATTLFLIAGKDVLPNEITNATIFFAVVSLAGVLGFGILWICMIVAHTQLLRIATKPRSGSSGVPSETGV